MKQELVEKILAICRELYGKDVEIEIFRPDDKFGDFSTNVALQLAGKLGKNPREIAEQVCKQLEGNEKLAAVDIAGPGFINMTLTDRALFESTASGTKLEKTLDGRQVIAEYSDPNPFKVLHVGHLYTSVVGDAISNIFEAAGANVHRVNYGGDVGLHVAKTLWAVTEELGGENSGKLDNIKQTERADWLAKCYVAGTAAYDTDERAKTEIAALNKKIYRISSEKDESSELGKIYWTTRRWSYDYFNQFYARLNIEFEKYYPESTVAEKGLLKVKENTPKVYSESDGAVIYEGEKDGLHTRVFITREGLPTYEAKEVGLIFKKQEDYNFDRSVVITANEQSQYMQVVLASINKFAPELVSKTTHLTHGIVKLPGAEKMSSRKGNFLKAVDILESVERSSKKINPDSAAEVILAAVKYSFLKPGLGGDIIFDVNESVSLEGNSGPYLQYAMVRANSIAGKADALTEKLPQDFELNGQERLLARKISMYPEVFEAALNELSPHYICTYLYELAQTFNRFYENNRVIGDARSPIRLRLVNYYADVLGHGLKLLGISTPERM